MPDSKDSVLDTVWLGCVCSLFGGETSAPLLPGLTPEPIPRASRCCSATLKCIRRGMGGGGKEMDIFGVTLRSAVFRKPCESHGPHIEKRQNART